MTGRVASVALRNEEWFKAADGRTPASVASWINDILASGASDDAALVSELLERVAILRDERGHSCLFDTSGPCEHMLEAVAESLIREFNEWALTRSPDSLHRKPRMVAVSDGVEPGTGAEGSLCPYPIYVRVLTTCLRMATRVVADAAGPCAKPQRFAGRRGSSAHEAAILAVLTERAAEVRSVIDDALARMAKAADAPVARFVEFVCADADRSPYDVQCVFEVQVTREGHWERHEVWVNIKSVRDVTEPINTMGMTAFRHAFGLGKAPKGTKAVDTIAAVYEALRNGAESLTDYAFWVFTKPSASGDPVVNAADVWISTLFGFDPNIETPRGKKTVNPLVFNASQSFPHIQIYADLAQQAMSTSLTVGEARARLWAWWEAIREKVLTYEVKTLPTGPTVAAVLEGFAAKLAENPDELADALAALSDDHRATLAALAKMAGKPSRTVRSTRAA